jgi:hypothetical protein
MGSQEASRVEEELDKNVVCQWFCLSYTANIALKGSGGQVIGTVKYADGLLILAEKEALLHGIIDKIIETGKCCGMDMAVERTETMGISRVPSLLQIMIDQKQLVNVEYFSCLFNTITNHATYISEINSMIATAKAAFDRKKTLFTSNWT